MEELIKDFSHLLVSLGLPGLIIVVLAMVIKRQDQDIRELHEKRYAEGRENVTALTSNTSALEMLTRLIETGRRNDH